MLKNTFILLSIIGAFCAIPMTSALASSTPNNNTPPLIDNIATQAVQACRDSKEGDGCMYIKDDTKFTGTCHKHEKLDDKLHCQTIK
ncbi:MAG TPA: hypothetical protein PLD88_12495 [Candidatus Berkiella sp.]|nr:hypothetical protein [Candidatus Berkiella sp.]